MKIATVRSLVLFGVVFLSAARGQEVPLSSEDSIRIARRVWQNECGGTVQGLTSWNSGENFASLGIGHFIWYPAGAAGPFEESFPDLSRLLAERGVSLPDWLKPGSHCPWSSRAEFQRDLQSARMKQLRQILAATLPIQTEFLERRLQKALPKMLEASAPSRREAVRRQFDRMSHGGSRAVYALIDYVNFKGEGSLATERYNGQGWGLLQVLENMPDSSSESPAADFARSAREVLARRVKNSPPERHEARWLPGWLNRVGSYAG